jgi:hypothetical protein
MGTSGQTSGAALGSRPACAVVIDDAAAALAHLSEVGRQLVAPTTATVCAAIRAAAADRRWPVVPYETFVAWVRRLPPRDDIWLVADKVFPVEALGVAAAVVDLHRAWSAPGLDALHSRLSVEIGLPTEQLEPGTTVTLLDDCAYTGRTIRAAIGALHGRGVRVSRVVLGASPAAVTGHDRALGVEIVAQHVVPRGCDILHMRDFLPWLPFSGRRVHGRPGLVCRDGSVLDHRLAPALFEGGAWLHIGDDLALRRTIEAGAGEVVAALGAYLGRPARIVDLGLLGRSVGIPISRPEQQVSQEDSLAEILPQDAGGAPREGRR